MKNLFLLILLVINLGSAKTVLGQNDAKPEKKLYMVPYAHLDTQWLWDYETTIKEGLLNTLDDNFKLFEAYPDYVFNFTGSFRYRLFQEYYPERFERLKSYIAQGRWKLAGSSVDEGDMLLVSPESVLRHILYGNQYFRETFGKESHDFLLPDCFGFPQSLPTLISHAGLSGFSTQKIEYWGSAVPVPFNLGMWQGLDGSSLPIAIKPGPYVASVPVPPHLNQAWISRVNEQCIDGLCLDYRYFGIGDSGGAPRKDDVEHVLASLEKSDVTQVIIGSSDQMFLDMPASYKKALPSYQGDFLLTEHSAGVLTSRAHMKRMNRANEILADQAERAMVMAMSVDPSFQVPIQHKMAWEKVLAAQMHDILPGTSINKAYEHSHNDEFIAASIFEQNLKDGLDTVIREMDTQRDGLAVAVYNSLLKPRELAQVTIELPIKTQKLSWVATGPQGQEYPVQVQDLPMGRSRLIWQAPLPALSVSIFSLELRLKNSPETRLKVSERSLENELYLVELGDDGDIHRIYDKVHKREVISAPIRYHFQKEYPRKYPSWNMDWKDRVSFPYAYVDGAAKFRIAQQGPLQVSLEVQREAQGSHFKQVITLRSGDPLIRVKNKIDWHTRASSLRVAFPLAVKSPLATYTNGLNPVERGNNQPSLYERPSQQWFDLTDSSQDYGVSILENGKFGSDKPLDHMLRLTLLYSPHTTEGFDNHTILKFGETQDFGKHNMDFAIYPHAGSWQKAGTIDRAKAFNHPVHTMVVRSHPGRLGRVSSLFELKAKNIGALALKPAEDGKGFILRLYEMFGEDKKSYSTDFLYRFASASFTDGQERDLSNGAVSLDEGMVFKPYQLKSLRVLAEPRKGKAKLRKKAQPLALRPLFNVDMISSNGQLNASPERGTYPGELWPGSIQVQQASMLLGAPQKGTSNAIAAKGQSLMLPKGTRSLQLLVAADEDLYGQFSLDGTGLKRFIPAWNERIGGFSLSDTDQDGKVWLSEDFKKDVDVAYFFTHFHQGGEDRPYAHSYLFHLNIPVKGASTLKLPVDPRLKIYAATASFVPRQELEDEDLLERLQNFSEDLTLLIPRREL